MSILDALAVPIIQAPMAGGPSTPALAAAVGDAGGLGFLAAGYLTPARFAEDIATTRALTTRPFGVNLFVVNWPPADPAVVAAYARRLQPTATAAGVDLGPPRFDDDEIAAKLDVLAADPVAVASFTFGLPTPEACVRLRHVGTEIWITVTSPAEAVAAAPLADALIVQGVEAGGHRAIHVDDDTASDLTLLSALQLIGGDVDRPLVASGGLATGAGIAAVLAAGASAAQLGTAFLCCPEAGTSAVQRAATSRPATTTLTRAFSGRLARGIRNRFHDEFGADAPHAYPEVHHLTAPLRAHARATGDAELVNLWAGQTHELARAEPAATLTRRLAADAATALDAATRRFGRGDAAARRIDTDVAADPAAT